MPNNTTLSPLEQRVMQILWEHSPCTAEDVRVRLAEDDEAKALKDSTVRTVLRRMEAKGFTTHRTDGRTYVYRPVVPRRKAAAQAVRRIVDRFCGGSVETLLVGMVDDRLLDARRLLELAATIDASATDTEETPND